ncbi:LCP family protein [Peribacillus butanolivorans]|uniref:Polyisoprenyl-teichoic acid--peptidoglycan teichoic acid transferase TagU n=1 Tax=Peribacillus butanolivorans TaxID=421767 RepID=A0AAX0S0Z4_9BACI|nr:LCP family protein [Peribacillus butanolivorans]AXN38785.1 LytR family transcriptional regulator [Peribacillus butanolivorans]PEJ30212.1 LytR family transcriptional regulator [Peribacillus butanolivorans]
MRSEHKKKKKKRQTFKIIGFTLLILFIGGGAYAASVYQSLAGAIHTMQGAAHKTDKRVDDIKFKSQDPFSLLILGVDERKNDKGRSDTMIVMTINPKQESIELLSLPRDTRTEIIGKGTNDKMNHAYAYGGVNMSINTVEAYLDIPIDYYVKMNMEGFQDIVNAVGGVTVDNDMDLAYKGYSFKKGTIDLDGKEALIYSRIRKEDPRGDYGRQMRQRQVIQAVMKKGSSLSTLTNYDDIFEALGKNVETNLSFNEMLSIQKNYKSSLKKIEQYTLEGDNQKVDGVWYNIVSEETKLEAQNRVKTHLGL